MRISDYIGQACGNLWKKKLRTFLTTSGVVIGVGALVCMLAFGQGIQRNVTDQFKKLDLFNYVNVFAAGGPDRPGESSDPDDDGGRRAEHGRRRGGPVPDANQPSPRLDAQALERIGEIDGVEAAFPEMRFPAQIRLGAKELFTLVQVLPADVGRSGLITLRSGACYASNEPNELVISDSLLHRLGVKDPETALGTKIEVATLTLDFSFTRLLQMVFSSGGQALPFARENYAFTVVGVAGRMGFMGPLPMQSDVLIPPGAAAKMRKLSLTSVWDLFAPSGGTASYSAVTVKVKSPQQVEPVKKEIESQGFRTFALMDQLEQMRIGFLIMDMFLIAVGMIGITVASLGIVNTMVMSILERYREIGIMKAVGATDGDVQRIFLFESGTIGLLGGLFGLSLGWAVSMVINEVINILMARQGAPRMDYFSFPWWLCLGAILFSILVSLLAGVYPTRRAARVDPVVALRHD
ncbi:MAG: ABC transporter permease [Phycisphaerae bacterium]|nr:ABC transporter permease [Phycisphaerae bacterium]